MVLVRSFWSSARARPRAHWGRGPLSGGVALLAASWVLIGCSGGETPVSAAEAKVAAQQKALDEAEAAATAASATFCSSSATYITALDRYGDILNATVPTVGDVKTGGRDLKQPGQDAGSAAQAAADAHRAVTQAERDLAAAQAELAAVRASATGGTAPPSAASSTSGSASPTTPSAELSAAVTRVQQAESEFQTAQSGVADATPLRRASQQFNAAAVALEMTWLQLYAEAGCLTDAQQEKAAQAVHDYTSALQQDLTDAGYYTGTVDGVYGPATVTAVEALQKAHGLPVTGTMDKATEAALKSDLTAKGGAAAQAAVASTAAVQQTLKLAGYWDGPVDGQWTPALTDALKKLQTDLKVPATGTVDAGTVLALEKAIEEAKATSTVTSTATVTQTTTTTVTSTSAGSP